MKYRIVILVMVLLIGSGCSFISEPAPVEVAEERTTNETPTEIQTEEALPIASPTPTPTETPMPAPTFTLEPTATPTEIPEPEIRDIAFKSESNDEPNNTFEEGVTEIQVVFDYQHLSNEYTWERVWYHDGQEMLRNTQTWTGDEAGQFDYLLDSGGEPLDSGEWRLELYVEGVLQAESQFTIESTIAPTTEPTDDPPPPPPTYHVTYSKWEGGFHNIYIADTNGQNEQLIFTRAAGPSFSPDKKRLFFFGEQGVNQQFRDGRVTCEFGTISGGIVGMDLTWPPQDICQVKFDTWFCERKSVDLQTEPSDVCTANSISVYQNLDWKEGTARWAGASPDGVAIAYDAKPGGDTYRIYFLKMLGTADQFGYEILGEQGSWSPDGQKMVYRSGRDNKQGLWISHREDRDHILITNSGTDSFPSWSPDGKTIAFHREVGGNVDIYTINVDGSNLQQLTTDPAPDTLPIYTPAGEIIFRSGRDNGWGIWKMSGTGANQHEIIPNAGVGPDWAFSKMDVK